MLPRDLNTEQFAAYPPDAKRLIVGHLEILRELPLAFVSSLLREAIDFDFKFPQERFAIEREVTKLSGLSVAERDRWFRPFGQLTISPRLEQFDWVNQPAQFTEQLSAFLWSSHQLDAFRLAATEYGNRLQSATPQPALPANRLGIAVIGQGVTAFAGTLFRNLREHGTYFSRIKPERGIELLLEAVVERSKQFPGAYAHWYVDGGEEDSCDSHVTCISYHSLEKLRANLLEYIRTQVEKPEMGPEELRTRLAQLKPEDLGMKDRDDEVLSRFKLKILTEGSGTQIFSTTFAQWTAREALRRAQPLTLLVRFAPRQRQRSMNELLSNRDDGIELDPVGSLTDADMAAYYHWINQQRLPGANRSTFLVWFEKHREAIVIAPTLPRGTNSSTEFDLKQLLGLATS